MDQLLAGASSAPAPIQRPFVGLGKAPPDAALAGLGETRHGHRAQARWLPTPPPISTTSARSPRAKNRISQKILTPHQSLQGGNLDHVRSNKAVNVRCGLKTKELITDRLQAYRPFESSGVVYEPLTRAP
jgi:hypothetical protein